MTEDSTQRGDVAPVLAVLEAFASAAGIRVDRAAGARLLAEARAAHPSDSSQAWSRCLVDVAQSVNLRIRMFHAPLANLWELVQQGHPLATFRTSADGKGHWLLLQRERRGRVQATLDGVTRWMSRKELARHVSLDERELWVLGEPALPTHASSASAGRGKSPLKPIARLLRFLRPEWHDIGVVGIFSVVVSTLGLATPLAVEAVVNTIAFGQFLQPLVILSVILFGSLAFAAVIQCLLTVVVEVLQRRLFVRVAAELAYRLPRTKSTAFDHYHGPELVNRFFEVVTVQKVIAKLCLETIALVLQTTIGMAVVAFYHPFLLGYDLVLLALMGLMVFVLGRGAIRTATQESQAKFEMAAWLQEVVRHPTAFKFHGGAQFALDRADQLAVDYLDARRGHFGIVLRQLIFAVAIQVIAATALLGLGGWLVMQGQLTLGQLVAAELIVTLIVGSFAKFGKHLESVYDLLASMDKLGKLFDLPMEDHDRLIHVSSQAPVELTCSQLVVPGVSLKPLDWTVGRGEQWAIHGVSGTGKSRLTDVLVGARHASGGHLQIDGIALQDLRPDSWRDQLGVARDIEIFQGTLEENIHLGRPHILSADVRDALEATGLNSYVQNLPDGMRTHLHIGGAPLSTGQALRLMLARAMVGRPRLIVIDGLLDRLGDEDLFIAVRALRHSKSTVIVTTGRHEIAQMFPKQLSLPPASHPNVGIIEAHHDHS